MVLPVDLACYFAVRPPNSVVTKIKSLLFIDFENGTRSGIDVLMKEGIEKRIPDNHTFLKSILDTVLSEYCSEGS